MSRHALPLCLLLGLGTSAGLWLLRGAEEPAPEPPAAGIGERFELKADQDFLREERRKIADLFPEETLPDSDRQRMARRAVEINHRLLIRFPDVHEVERYVVRSGDSLIGIARKFPLLKGCEGSIVLLNELNASSPLPPGLHLRIGRGRWSILVDKSLVTLYLCHEGAPFKSYPVAIGANGKTPSAEFTVDAKNPKPMWWPPRSLGIRAPVKHGDPRNPLGEWWIGLEHRLHQGFGIHGTNDPGSIGMQASLGCVRMRNEDVGEIAAIAHRGMAVRIVD